MKKFLLFVSLIISSCHLWSQEMPVNGPDIAQCGGFLVDDGFSASNYGNNQNQTITICTDGSIDIINLYFTVCALGTGDYLEIFDGPNTGSPLIGTYYDTDLQTTDITSTNASGCLTVHFVSDANGVGNFGAEISCGPPCERPFAIITSAEDPAPLLICPGEAVTFDGSESTFANGASLASFEWVFDDGTTNTTSWPTVTHTFDEPGGYEVQLFLTDDNDCSNNNLPDYVVLVSTYPDFSLLSPEFDLCQGGTEWMGVNYFIPDSIFSDDSLNVWISEPWNDLPDVNFGGALFIPDDQTQCFSDEITFTNFDIGSTVDNILDIENLYINFEHTFMGDIVITFICPNGQSIAVHQQGGGGTWLGDAIDDELENPGVGWDYYWDPEATNGTWEENVGLGSPLPAGTYESVQSFDVLLGCPLNGTWTVEICDMWGADNGYIFDWSVNFNPELFGDLLQFEPIYGPDCDSTFWTGPNIITQSDGCDFIQIELNQTGIYDYTYTAINNFGCTFDTTITVNVFVAPSVTAGPDLIYNCDPVQLQGGLDGEPVASCADASGNYEECFGNNENWIQTYCPDNSGDGVTFITITINSGDFESWLDELWVYDGPSTGSPILAGPLFGDVSGMTFTATNAEGCLTLSFSSDGSVSCADGWNGPFNYDVGCASGEMPFVWEWTPVDGLSNPNIPNPIVDEISFDMTYVLSGYPVGYPGCGTTDEVNVNLDPNLPNPGEDTDIFLCPESDPISMFETLNGDPEAGGIWYDDNGIEVQDGFDPGSDPQGSYYYTLVVDGCALSTELAISVQYPICEASNDTIICINGTAVLQAWSNTDPNGTYIYTWSTGEVSDEIEVTPAAQEDYSVFATDADGCVSEIVEMTVSYYDPLEVAAINDTVICLGGEVLASVIDADGGFGNYSYQWSFNGSAIGSGEEFTHSPTTNGDYCVVITDECETPSATDCMSVSIELPLSVEIGADTTDGCAPLAANLFVVTDESLYTVSSWQLSDGFTSTDDDFNHSFSTPGSYDISLTLTSAIGCSYENTFPNYITVFNNPIAQWTAEPQPTNIDNTDIQFFDHSIGTGLQYDWVFNTDNPMGQSNEQHPQFLFPEGVPGIYPVLLTVTDANSCVDFYEAEIVIHDELNIFIPNSFTPNGDGINDTWLVFGTDIDPTDFELIVFSRWGDVVFRSANPAKPWLGEFQGSGYFAPDGVYPYVLKVSAATTQRKEKYVGHIVLIR